METNVVFLSDYIGRRGGNRGSAVCEFLRGGVSTGSAAIIGAPGMEIGGSGPGATPVLGYHGLTSAFAHPRRAEPVADAPMDGWQPITIGEAARKLMARMMLEEMREVDHAASLPVRTQVLP